MYSACKTKEQMQQNIITSTNCVVPENIHTPPPTEGFFGLKPPPLWKFQFEFTLSFFWVSEI